MAVSTPSTRPTPAPPCSASAKTHFPMRISHRTQHQNHGHSEKDESWHPTCGQQSRAQLSPDEELTPEECLALYCKPVELYNIIRLRAIKSPPSLQRCISYEIDARRKKRIQMSVSISGSTNTELPAHGIFPLTVMFARATSNDSFDRHSPVHRFRRACLLTSVSESGDNWLKDAIELGGRCSWGNIPIDLFSPSLDNCVTLSLGRTVELTSEITVKGCF